MKKLISLIMCVVLLVSCFTACSPQGTIDKETTEPETRGAAKSEKKDDDDTITITIVCPEMPVSDKNDLRDMYRLLHDDYNVELKFEYLVDDSNNGYAEYKSMLTRIRAEVMAGEGPDVFILPTWDVRRYYDDNFNLLERQEPLFPDVEDAMRNRIFLELDDYLAKSDIINMNDHRSSIMDAGKVDGRQMVMPLLFDFEMQLLDGNQLENPDFTYTDFESYVSAADSLVHGTMGDGFNWFHHVLAEYIDYDNEKLNITPDELAHNLEQSWNILKKKADSGAPYEDENFYYATFDDYFFYAWKNSEGQAVPVYIPNVEGGITAMVNMYAAINANTEYPEEAFKVLELLFSENLQTGSGFYSEERGHKMFGGWRPNMMFGVANSYNMVTSKKTYTDPYFHNTEEIEELLSKINCVRFTSELDCMLCDAVDSFEYIYYGPDRDKGPDFDAIAEALIKDMEMRLAE